MAFVGSGAGSSTVRLPARRLRAQVESFQDFATIAEPASTPERRAEWQQELLAIWITVVGIWTALDCALDPGVNPVADPSSLLKIALPTSLLVGPGAAVAACARLQPRPVGMADAEKTCAVFVGDSLTQGTVSSNVLQVLEAQCKGLPDIGHFVNAGLNFRALSDALDSNLLEEAAALQPSHGLVLQLGSNDLIRYAAGPAAFRAAEAEWLASYEEQLRQAVRRVSRASFPVLLVSPPPLGEDLRSTEGRLGASMASAVQRVASDEGCRYVPLFEACADHLQDAAKRGTLATNSRAYSLGESLFLLCALPWRLYVGNGRSLKQIQAEAGLELTVDLVHYGPTYAEIAAKLLTRELGLEIGAG